jgi:hypothetical protein
MSSSIFPVQHRSRRTACLYARPLSSWTCAERDSARISATGFGIVVLTGVVLAVYNNLFAVI